ncbi:MAG: substrate-binding domain-containing protein [Spirochaetales bacterium]|nr:substrate-binding domain-containing protein [Spirochaetales bacterium]
MTKIIIGLFGLACLTGGLSTGLNAEDGDLTIGLSFSDFHSEFWAKQNEIMRGLLESVGADAITVVANYNAEMQGKRIDSLIERDVDAVIVVAVDGEALIPAVERAAAAGVPVVAFDRLIPSDKLAAYVSFDQYEIGRLQARGVLDRAGKGRFVLLGGGTVDTSARRFRAGQMEILKPLIDRGRIEIVADQWVRNWDPDNAYKIMNNIISATGGEFDAVVASNDGTALGAIDALREHGLAGKVPISGQDATAEACTSIVRGELTMTVFKDFRLLAPAAVDLALRLARREPVPELENRTIRELTYDRDYEGTVPCLFIPSVAVDEANLYDEIVASGFQPYDEVYRDVPEADRPPRP